MNRKFKKVISLALAAVMTCSLASCGSDKGKEEVTTIKWYAYENPSADVDEVFAKVNEYTKEKIGVVIDYTPITPAEYNEKMKMIFASNEEFDMCFQSSSTDFYTNVENGVLMPLDELLDTTGKATRDLIPEFYYDAATVNGEIYAIPMNKDVAEQWGFRFSSDIANQCGITKADIEAVTSLAELEPIFQKVKDTLPNVYPCLIRGNNHFLKFLPFDNVNGCSVGAFRTDDFDKIINQFETKEIKEYFDLMRSWYQKGFFRSDAATATNDNDIKAAGNWFACYVGYLPYSDYYAEGQPVEWWYALNMNEPHIRTGNIMGSAFAISANSPNPEKTMELINLINTDEYLRNLIAYGIEGEHWVSVGDGQYKLPDGFQTKVDTGYESLVYTNGNRFILKTSELKPADMWDKFKEFNENAVKYDNIGFVFNPENVMTEIVAVENVCTEFLPALAVGAIDPDENLPKFLEKLEKVGVQTVIDEMQRQYDEWKKNK